MSGLVQVFRTPKRLEVPENPKIILKHKKYLKIQKKNQNNIQIVESPKIYPKSDPKELKIPKIYISKIENFTQNLKL